jgi:hypothetical protein
MTHKIGRVMLQITDRGDLGDSPNGGLFNAFKDIDDPVFPGLRFSDLKQ